MSEQWPISNAKSERLLGCEDEENKGFPLNNKYLSDGQINVEGILNKIGSINDSFKNSSERWDRESILRKYNQPIENNQRKSSFYSNYEEEDIFDSSPRIGIKRQNVK